MSDTNERSVASAGSVAGRPLGDPEVAVEILKLRVAELEQAIRRLAEQDATLSVCDGNVTVTMDATLTDAEMDDLRVWLAECLRQASTATEGANEELAERWQERAKRAAAMIERTGGGK